MTNENANDKWKMICYAHRLRDTEVKLQWTRASEYFAVVFRGFGTPAAKSDVLFEVSVQPLLFLETDRSVARCNSWTNAAEAVCGSAITHKVNYRLVRRTCATQCRGNIHQSHLAGGGGHGNYSSCIRLGAGLRHCCRQMILESDSTGPGASDTEVSWVTDHDVPVAPAY